MLSTLLDLKTQRDASCPEVAPLLCMEEEIEPHQQQAQLLWMRFAPKISVGLAEGWKISLRVPMNVRWFDVSYLRTDGSSFEPAYADEAGSGERVQGLGDPAVMLAKIGRWPGGWIGEVGGGVTLPLGNTEDNPYARNQLGSLQQHAQMGAGTVQPVVKMQVIREQDGWRSFVSTGLTLSLYTNAEGYRPPAVYVAEAGASRELGERFDGLLGLNLSRTSKDYWEGVAYPGREALNAKLGLTAHLGLNWLFEVQAQLLIKEGLLAVPTSDMMTRRGSITFGMSWKN